NQKESISLTCSSTAAGRPWLKLGLNCRPGLNLGSSFFAIFDLSLLELCLRIRQVSITGWQYRVALQVSVNALFHLSRKLRHGADELFTVDSEHDFSEHRKRDPAASFSWSEGTVVVEADPDGDSDSFGPVSRAYEQCIPELVCRPRLSHDGDREPAGVEHMSRAAGN